MKPSEPPERKCDPRSIDQEEGPAAGQAAGVRIKATGLLGRALHSPRDIGKASSISC